MSKKAFDLILNSIISIMVKWTQTEFDGPRLEFDNFLF